MHLYWQVRHEAEWIHRAALERHARADPRLRLHLLASRPQGGPPQRIDSERLRRDLDDLRDAQYFVCAGPALLDAICRQLGAAGVPRAAIHYERFGASGRNDASGAWQLEVDGRRIAFDGHASILDACESAGIALASDCRSGTCGLCRLAILSGEVVHAVEPAPALPPGFALACCAVPRSDLRLATTAG